MEIILTVIFTLLGIAVGSFLNVCIDRLPLRQSLVSPPSRCDACEHRLSPVDLVPVFSYILLRGRCRYCRARIPFRILLVEICSGVVFFLDISVIIKIFSSYWATIKPASGASLAISITASTFRKSSFSQVPSSLSIDVLIS